MALHPIKEGKRSTIYGAHTKCQAWSHTISQSILSTNARGTINSRWEAESQKVHWVTQLSGERRSWDSNLRPSRPHSPGLSFSIAQSCTVHLNLNEFKLSKLQFSSSGALATLQVVNSHTWLVATVLDTADIDNFCHCEKIFQTTLLSNIREKRVNWAILPLREEPDHLSFVNPVRSPSEVIFSK